MYGMRVIFIIIVSSVFDVSSVGLFGNDVDSKQLLHHLTESEKLFLFGSNNADPQFEIAHLKHQKRHKRSLKTDNHELESLKKHLNIKLNPRHNFIDPQFLLMKRWLNGTEAVLDKYMDDEVDLCFYKSDTAALYVCDDVRGVVKSNDSYYSIHPLPERFHNEKFKPHVIIKRNADLNTNENNENICIEKDSLTFTENSEPIKMWSKHRRKREIVKSTGEDNSLHKFKLNLAHRNKTISDFVEKLASQENQTDRQKRSVLPAIFVETAVFVDRDLYKLMTINFPKDTERELVRFVLAMINAVQLIYHDSSLGRPVNFILKRLEILHEDPANLKRPHDIDRFLSNFCTWQRLENPPGDNDPLHWDHALILTGLDLYVVNKNGKVSSQVVGLAPVAGMCTVTSSCTVNEGRHFESVFVVAHEIGHNLGMRHDGPNADNACDPSAFIMSPTLGSGKITWSQCSRNYLQKFLDTSQSRCLLDHGNSAGQLDHSAEGILPGERFDADQQCMLKYGRGSRRSASQSARDVCRDLHCARERYTWTSHPALDGTRCGDDLFCRGGLCVARAGLDARWSRWSEWSECASACLWDERPAPAAAGVAVATRRCTRPRYALIDDHFIYRRLRHGQPRKPYVTFGEELENGKSFCQGHDKKYQSCYAQQCKTVPKMTVRDFADQICRRARDVDPDLIGTGLQRLDTDDTQSACAVWCDTRGGGYKSRGWTFPDGTACSNEANKFCISGACRKFSCSGNTDTEFSLTSGDCEWEALQVQTATPHTTKSSGTWRRAVDGRWRAASACHFRCMARGSGLRLVRARDRASIQLCTPDAHTAEEGCSQQMSSYQFATMVCSKYKERVRRLSGLGMQISPTIEEPDRSCRVACQDERAPQRFFLVNGPRGWFPLGTACARSSSTDAASRASRASPADARYYCVGGKCLEFGPDLTPVSEAAFASRRRRSLLRDRVPVRTRLPGALLDDIIAALNLTDNTRGSIYFETIPDNIELDFSNPIHISPEDTLIKKRPRPTWD